MREAYPVIALGVTLVPSKEVVDALQGLFKDGAPEHLRNFSDGFQLASRRLLNPEAYESGAYDDELARASQAMGDVALCLSGGPKAFEMQRSIRSSDGETSRLYLQVDSSGQQHLARLTTALDGGDENSVYETLPLRQDAVFADIATDALTSWLRGSTQAAGRYHEAHDAHPGAMTISNPTLHLQHIADYWAQPIPLPKNERDI